VINFESSGIDRPKQYDWNEYRNIYDLESNTSKHSTADLFKRTTMAVILAELLKKTKFFDDSKCQFSFVASLLLQHIQNLACNAHEIVETELVGTELAKTKSIEIGAGAYATLSLLNHSCDPNVARSYYGSHAVVRAIRPIRKGEELLDCYGYHFMVTEKITRQYSLERQYFFTCSCKACIENWPMLEQLTDEIRLKCCPFSEKCQKCSEVLRELEKCAEKFEDIKGFLCQRSSVADDVWCFLYKYLQLLDDYTVRPSITYFLCQEVLKYCFSTLGTFYVRP